jgi:DNA replication protein DnaC
MTTIKIETIKEALRMLNLKAMLDILEETLLKAQKQNLSVLDILHLLAAQEIAARQERLVKTRIAQAKFPVIKTLDSFDFAFPAAIQKSQVLSLFDLTFVEQKHNAILMGPPGTGKTHIALAL